MLIGHPGGLEGAQTLLLLEPQNEIVFALFVNRAAMDYMYDDIFKIFSNFVN